jgi:hypothetical protein
MVKVVWATNKEIEEIAGYRRVYKNSWIKGVTDSTDNTIFLNVRLRKLKHSHFYIAECLSHELFHMINGGRLPKIDKMFDKFGRVLDHYIFARNYKGERIRK